MMVSTGWSPSRGMWGHVGRRLEGDIPAGPEEAGVAHVEARRSRKDEALRRVRSQDVNVEDILLGGHHSPRLGLHRSPAGFVDRLAELAGPGANLTESLHDFGREGSLGCGADVQEQVRVGASGADQVVDELLGALESPVRGVEAPRSR